MKYIFFNVLILICNSVISQNNQYFVDEYTYYQLNDSIHFTFGQTGFCGSAPTGHGTYQKEGKIITFKFSSGISTPNIILADYPLGKNNVEKFKVRIICLEDSVNSFPFVSLYYLDSLNNKKGNYTDIDGVCEFEIEKNNFKDTIFIRYPGIPKIEIPVLPYNQTLEIILPIVYPFEIHDATKIYRIGRKNKLILLED